MRILVVNTPLPNYEVFDGIAQDQLGNLKDLLRLGHEIQLLTRNGPHRTMEESQRYYQKCEYPVHLISWQKRRMLRHRFTDVAYINGIAWEYGKPDFIQALEQIITAWHPDIVWCHSTFLWPVAAKARRYGIPTVVRSVNYEPNDWLQRTTHSLKDMIQLAGIWLGERRATKYANVLAAITPDEQHIYQTFNRQTKVHVLPLRSLAYFLAPTPRPIQDRKPLRVFYMGSKYTASHNRAALDFIVDQIVPLVREKAPGSFEFHILGSRLPAEVAAKAAPDLIFPNYVPDLAAYLQMMDIALVPSLIGPGMQQKIFEPLCRGFPLITHRRGIAGYPFENGVHVLFADSPEAFVQQLIRLQDTTLRNAIATQGLQRANELFSLARADEQVKAVLADALG